MMTRRWARSLRGCIKPNPRRSNVVLEKSQGGKMCTTYAGWNEKNMYKLHPIVSLWSITLDSVIIALSDFYSSLLNVWVCTNIHISNITSTCESQHCEGSAIITTHLWLVHCEPACPLTCWVSGSATFTMPAACFCCKYWINPVVIALVCSMMWSWSLPQGKASSIQ